MSIEQEIKDRLSALGCNNIICYKDADSHQYETYVIKFKYMDYFSERMVSYKNVKRFGVNYLCMSLMSELNKRMSELDLIAVAQSSKSDQLAFYAMKELRSKYDSSYFWCEDCDGLVCKEKDCCMNAEPNQTDAIDF